MYVYMHRCMEREASMLTKRKKKKFFYAESYRIQVYYHANSYGLLPKQQVSDIYV